MADILIQGIEIPKDKHTTFRNVDLPVPAIFSVGIHCAMMLMKQLGLSEKLLSIFEINLIRSYINEDY